MELRYQQITDYIKIARNTLNIRPVVIDYSNTYRYNQYDVIGLTETTVIVDEFDNKYVSHPAITNDNVMVTRKVDQWNNPLFYQYQPKYDCLYPENLKVMDNNDKNVDFIMEYGYIDSTPTLLSDNKVKFFDAYDSYTLNGKLGTENVLYNNLNVYYLLGATLPFTLYGSCLYNGIIYYDNIINDIDVNIMSIYFLVKDVDNFASTEFLYTVDEDGLPIGDISIAASGVPSLEVNIGASESIPLSKSIWYRLDYHYNNTEDSSSIVLHNLSTLESNTYNSFTSMFKDYNNFYVRAEYNVCFDLAFFKDTLPDKDKPLFVHRYSKTINWVIEKPVSSPYRIRLLFNTDIPATLTYDAIDENSNLMQNKIEEINYRLIYKKYVNSAGSNDWFWDSGNSRIILKDTLADESEENDLIYVFPIIDDQIRVFYDEFDKKIHVVDGYFRSDNYDSVTNLDYYNVPEYEKMPFASDNQTVFKPYYIKIIRGKANLISSHEIQINRFYIYEGDYPNYTIPNSYEIYKYYDADGVLQEWTSGVEHNYITARGINVFRNNVLIDNSEIVDYNMHNGTIRFMNKFSANDKIEVTYLRKMNSFILSYPVLSDMVSNTEGGIGDTMGFRIYIRPHYPDYDLENPGDTQIERLCYKFLVDGVPTGDFRSCLTNLTFNPVIIAKHLDRIIPLADVYIMRDRAFVDMRVRGGGIQENMKDKYSKWPAFLDIGYGIDGKLLYQSMILIKIPWDVVEDLKDKYFGSNNEEGTIVFIKQSIEKYIASGTFYCIIDSNNMPWPNPYPSFLRR